MSAEIALLQLVLTPQSGATWLEGSVQGLTQMMSSPEFPASGGSPSLLQRWRTPSSRVKCGQGWDPLNKRLHVHNKGTWLGFHSTVPQRRQRRVLTRSVFVSSSCAASGARSPSRPLSAGVASHLTPVATTVQRARHQGCSDVEGFRWRVVPRASAEKLERGYPPTSVSRNSTSCQEASWMTVAWKWSLMVCLSSTEPSWPSTRPWSVPSEQMEPHGDIVPPETELLSTRHAAPRSADTLSLIVLACETGGRWSEEAHDFLRHLARARARSEPPEIRAVARRSWFRRWCTALSCCAAQAFALSLLERRGCLGADGEVPSTSDVVWDDRFPS